LINHACLLDMNDTNIIIHQLEKKISELETRRDDLIARLPAHSLPPSMIAELDEIEEQLSQAKLQMAALIDHNAG
jgi:chromatin segregation and condensation protein Rec8/ScpA/Scc1 (kleisin family)